MKERNAGPQNHRFNSDVLDPPSRHEYDASGFLSSDFGDVTWGQLHSSMSYQLQFRDRSPDRDGPGGGVGVVGLANNLRLFLTMTSLT